MPLTKVPFSPGVNKEGTQYSANIGWYDADKVRFRKGRIEKIGGWQKIADDAIKGVPRSIQDWGTSTASYYIGTGTNLKYYVFSGGSYTDITPIDRTTSAGDITFAATDGSSSITVSETDHGAGLGDFVTYSSAASLGGTITSDVLNQEYQVASVIDSDNYTITAKDTNGDEVDANSSDTGNGGASVVGAYQIPVGTNSYLQTNGWGSGGWGAGYWGVSSALSLAGQLRLYSQDVFGDDLVFNPRNGGIYYWDESVGGRGFPISQLAGANSTPASALQVMVSDIDRHVLAFGASPLGSSAIDRLLVRWSDQENAGDWLPTATNSAGGQVLSTGTQIVGAIKARQENLIFTDEGVTSMRFVGAPYVFAFSLVSQNTSMISPRGGIAVGDSVYFMDSDGFYIYQGNVQRLPCSVFAYVFDNLNQDQKYKIFCVNNPDFSEVTWFYPVGTGSTDITNYVTYNYLEQSWVTGTLDRGAYIHAPTQNNPVASSNNVDDVNSNYLYFHEFGHDADGDELVAYAESGGFEIADGESLSFASRIIPDFRFEGAPGNADISITVSGRDFPLDDFTVLSTSSITASTKQSHIRARARELSVKFTSSGPGYGWTLGDIRFQFRTDGKR